MARFELVDIELLCPVCRGDMPLLSLRIIARRKTLGMKRYPLARRLGIDARTLARLERGSRPRRKVLRLVLRWLNASQPQTTRISRRHERAERHAP